MSAQELIDAIEGFMAPLRCTEPGRPAPDIEHCAGCCMQTGYLAQSWPEQQMCEALDAALAALHRVLDDIADHPELHVEAGGS